MRHLLSACLLITLIITAKAQDAQNVKLLCNWKETAGMPDHNGQYFNDVWGFTWRKKEYAAIGSTLGVHIIDVDNCKQVAFQAGNSVGWHIIHRDYKIYKNYLYAVCDEGNSSRLQIFDISTLPEKLELVYESSNDEIVNTHNIFIDTAKAKLYTGVLSYYNSSGNLSRQHMGVYSLADPRKPKLLTYFNYDYVHDMYVRNDTAYCSASMNGYVIVDFSKDTTYEILGVLPDYDYSGYNHSSWINSKGIGVMADETHGMPMKVINTLNINNIEVMGHFMPRWLDTTCIPHNPYILNDDYVLISYYYDGLQIYNISKPDSPYRVGYYDTYPGSSYRGYAGAWGCYPYLPSHRILVSDMQTGLYVFNADSALDIHRIDTTLPSPVVPAVENFVLYPNPAKDKVAFIMPETGHGSVRIYDITGKCILKQSFYADTASNQVIELPLPRNFPAGMYTMRVLMRDNSYKGKFIKVQN